MGVVDLDRKVQEIDEMFLFTFVERLPYHILPNLALYGTRVLSYCASNFRHQSIRPEEERKKKKTKMTNDGNDNCGVLDEHHHHD